MMKKLLVALLYGGKSVEHEVSVNSAISIMENLNTERYDLLPIGIDKAGICYTSKLSDVFFPESHQLLLSCSSSRTFPNIVSCLAAAQKDFNIDVLYSIILGPRYEDGAIQGLMEHIDIPFVGSSVLGSAVGMNKDIAKRIVAHNIMRTPKHITLYEDSKSSRVTFARRVQEKFDYPVFVKACNLGSSVAIYRVSSRTELDHAINDALQYDASVLVEEAIDAREIEISIIGDLPDGAPPIASAIGELQIIESHEFYTYSLKYLDKAKQPPIIPAQLTEEESQTVTSAALRMYGELGCSGMVRIDMFQNRRTGEILFNEFNTVPSFSANGTCARLWRASGMAYSDLLDRLIALAIDRHERKSKLIVDCQHFLT